MMIKFLGPFVLALNILIISFACATVIDTNSSKHPAHGTSVCRNHANNQVFTLATSLLTTRDDTLFADDVPPLMPSVLRDNCFTHEMTTTSGHFQAGGLLLWKKNCNFLSALFTRIGLHVCRRCLGDMSGHVAPEGNTFHLTGRGWCIKD